MKTRTLLTMTLWMLACHGQDETRPPKTENTQSPPVASADASAAVSPAPVDEAGSVPTAPIAPIAVAFDAPTHFKSGARGRAGDVTFTVRMLPKLIVSGPEPEIEQAQIDASRGNEHTTLQLDTRHKQAEWSGVVFELGYADTYHDDIELTVRRKK